jgi:hypothetical protein
MLSSQSRPSPLSSAALREFIRKVLDTGLYRETFHSEVEVSYRNISDDDIRHGLEQEGWELEGEPEFDPKYGNFKYVIRTVDVEGDELHLVVAPDTKKGTLKIITKY